MKYSSRQTPNKHWLKRIDWVLIGILTILAIFSVTLISSAMGGGQYSANFSIRQVIYYILGAFIALIIMLFSPKKIKKIHIYYILFFVYCLSVY
ncbi:cell cycle protein, FtsW/RodA/SpoVE domain protein [Staphylococcus lugdunensis VCU139]|nr:cell cycle protein, FtsW/RodA/SpoVE domain protein [Staphylococcus lugdunensis VCU139]